MPLYSFAQIPGQINDWGNCVVDDVPTLKCLEIVFGNILLCPHFLLSWYFYYVCGWLLSATYLHLVIRSGLKSSEP